MTRTGYAALALAALALPSIAAADTPPPAGALPLSRVLATVEAELGSGLSFIEDVSWDDDGYWDIEYRTTDGREAEIRVDPLSGQTRTR